MNGLDFRQNPLKTSCLLLFITPQQNAKKLEKNDGTVQRCCVANEQTERQKTHKQMVKQSQIHRTFSLACLSNNNV